MPRIPPDASLFCIYLFNSLSDARLGAHSGGCGFFIGLPWESDQSRAHVYAVTNDHVVRAADGGSKATVIRFTDRNAGLAVPHQTQLSEWRFPNVRSDLAIRLMESNLDLHTEHIKVIADDETIRSHDIGTGDEVFSLGRSVDIGESVKNHPVARFGNVAIMPEVLVDQIPSYVVEMRSRTGFSGSPVYVYIPGAKEVLGRSVKLTAHKFYGPWLLGVHAKQLPIIGPQAPPGNIGSGMCAIVPAKILKEFIMNDRLIQEERREVERAWNSRPHAIKETQESSNQGHKEAFTSLLNAAAKTKPQAD